MQGRRPVASRISPPVSLRLISLSALLHRTSPSRFLHLHLPLSIHVSPSHLTIPVPPSASPSLYPRLSIAPLHPGSSICISISLSTSPSHLSIRPRYSSFSIALSIRISRPSICTSAYPHICTFPHPPRWNATSFVNLIHLITISAITR